MNMWIDIQFKVELHISKVLSDFKSLISIELSLLSMICYWFKILSGSRTWSLFFAFIEYFNKTKVKYFIQNRLSFIQYHQERFTINWNIPQIGQWFRISLDIYINQEALAIVFFFTYDMNLMGLFEISDRFEWNLAYVLGSIKDV